MVDDVVAEHEAGALPQAVQGIKDAGQVLVDLAFEFLARVGAQGTDHEDAVGLARCTGCNFQIEDQAFGLRR